MENSLSRRERQIMEIVYRRGEATASEILEGLNDSPSYTTFSGLLGILMDIQQLLHAEEGPRYVYSPTVSRQRARTGAVTQVVDTFFNGSASQLVAALLGNPNTKITTEELEELSALIASARKKGR